MERATKNIWLIYAVLIIYLAMPITTQAQSYNAYQCLNTQECYCQNTSELLISGGIIQCPSVDCTAHNGNGISQTTITTTVRSNAPVGPNIADIGRPWHWFGECWGRVFGFDSLTDCVIRNGGGPTSATPGGSVTVAPSGINIICISLPSQSPSTYLPLIKK
jgi:hypothetical protein